MASPSSEPIRSRVDPVRAKQYAAATLDDNPFYLEGKYAPPVFGVVPTWDALLQGIAGAIPPELMLMTVHGEQDMWFHQPLVPGMELTTTATRHSIRRGGSGSRVVIHLDTRDADGRPVMEIFNTAFVRGWTDATDEGPDKPDHAFPEAARDRRVGEHTVHLPAGVTYAYSEASGDLMPIHLDEDVARAAGLPGIIVHGLCTMAVCSQAVVRTVAGGDPARLKRLAVRFAKNVLPDSDVTVTLYDAGPEGGAGAHAFEAHSRGELVIANGRAQVEG